MINVPSIVISDDHCIELLPQHKSHRCFTHSNYVIFNAMYVFRLGLFVFGLCRPSVLFTRFRIVITVPLVFFLCLTVISNETIAAEADWSLLDSRKLDARNRFIQCATVLNYFCDSTELSDTYDYYKVRRGSLIQELEKLYSTGYFPAGYLLAEVLLESEKSDNQLPKIINLLEKSAESTYGLSNALLGDLYLSERLGSIDVQRAINQYTLASMNGLVYPRIQLARMELSTGDLISADDDLSAQMIMTELFSSGRKQLFIGNSENIEKQLFAEIRINSTLDKAIRGHLNNLQLAMTELRDPLLGPLMLYEAMILTRSDDADQRIHEIIELLQRSGIAGIQMARIAMAYIYRDGIGLPVDTQLAAINWGHAADCYSRMDYGVFDCNSLLSQQARIESRATSATLYSERFHSIDDVIALSVQNSIPDIQLEDSIELFEEHYQYPLPRPILALPWQERSNTN